MDDDCQQVLAALALVLLSSAEHAVDRTTLPRTAAPLLELPLLQGLVDPRSATDVVSQVTSVASALSLRTLPLLLRLLPLLLLAVRERERLLPSLLLQQLQRLPLSLPERRSLSAFEVKVKIVNGMSN